MTNAQTGEVLADAVDFELPGPLPLVFERNYQSRCLAEGPLGPGWSHPLDLWVREVDEGIEVRLPDGRIRRHEPLAPGASCWDDLDRYTLSRSARGFELATWDGRTYVFEPIPGAPVTWALTRLHDRCGNEILCRYEGGRLAEVTDSAGRLLRFATQGGRLTAVQIRRRRGEDGWLELVRHEYED